MNPKITITVDSKGKASAALSGVVSVGAKVDVELHGMPSQIPNWLPTSDFTGPSVRFRIVDDEGEDVVRFPLEKKTSQKIAGGDQWTTETVDGKTVYKTYSGSATSPYAEFNTERMRSLFKDTAYNESQSLGVIIDSTVDAAEYAVGKVKVSQWKGDPGEDPAVLPELSEEVAAVMAIVVDKAAKPTTGTLGADSSLNDVITKINTLITELKA